MPWSISSATIITPEGKQQQHLDIPPFHAIPCIVSQNHVMQYPDVSHNHVMKYPTVSHKHETFFNMYNRKLNGTFTQILNSSIPFKIFWSVGAVSTFINFLEMHLERACIFHKPFSMFIINPKKYSLFPKRKKLGSQKHLFSYECRFKQLLFEMYKLWKWARNFSV